MNFHVSLFLSALFILGGCSGPEGDFLKERLFISKKNTVKEETHVHLISWPSESDQPSLQESQRLSFFLLPFNRDSTRILIEGGPAEQKKSPPRLYRKAQKIAEFIERMGFVSSHVKVIPLAARYRSNGEGDPSEILVAAETYRVIPPACPDWSHGLGKGFSSLPHSNFGCSNEAALGHMVVNPQDLMQGMGEEGMKGSLAYAAITRYHEDKIKQPSNISTTASSSGGSSSSSSSSSSSGA